MVVGFHFLFSLPFWLLPPIIKTEWAKYKYLHISLTKQPAWAGVGGNGQIIIFARFCKFLPVPILAVNPLKIDKTVKMGMGINGADRQGGLKFGRFE